MADIYFRCEGCEQPVVVDESGAGVMVECPQCGNGMQIPAAGMATARRSSAATRPANERIFAVHSAASFVKKEAPRSEQLLADALQELGRLRQEVSIAEMRRRDAEQTADGFKNKLNRVTAALATAEHQSRETEAALKAGHDALHADHSDRGKRLDEMEATVTSLHEQVANAKNESARLADELQRAQTELRDASEKLAAVAAERAKLAHNLELNPDLARFVQLRDAGEKFQEQLARAEFRLAETRNDVNIARGQRDVLRKEKIELELRYAAAREAIESNQLHQDNELLRSLVDRLNEELREVGGARRHRARRGSVLSISMSGVKRWIVSRAFVPES